MDWKNSWLADFVDAGQFPDPALDFMTPRGALETTRTESSDEAPTEKQTRTMRSHSVSIANKGTTAGGSGGAQPKRPVPPKVIATSPPPEPEKSTSHSRTESGSWTDPPKRRSGSYQSVPVGVQEPSSKDDASAFQRAASTSLTANKTKGRPASKSNPAGDKASKAIKIEKRATVAFPKIEEKPPTPPPRTDLEERRRSMKRVFSSTDVPTPTESSSPLRGASTNLIDVPEITSETVGRSRAASVGGPRPILPAEKRTRIMQEIVTSEETYKKGLEILVEWFMGNIRKLGEKVAPAKQISAVFSNAEQILTVCRELCNQLRASIVDLPTAPVGPPLGSVFLKMGPFLKSYAIYAANYSNALSVLAEWRANSTINNVMEQGRKTNGQDIEFYLILPIQRIPRYELLLRDLISVTPETHSDYEQLSEALKNMKQIADHVNSLVKQYQNSERAVQLGLKELMAPARRLVADGVFSAEVISSTAPPPAASSGPTPTRSPSSAAISTVAVPSKKIQFQMVLFNDMLLRNEGARKKWNPTKHKYHWPIQLVWVRELPNVSYFAEQSSTGVPYVEYPMEVLGPDGCYVVFMNSVPERTTWIQHFRECVAEASVKEAHHDPDVRFGRYKFADGGLYDGWWYHAKRHGMGTYTLLGTKYIGEWLANQMNGQGKLQYLSGAVYSGSFLEGKPTGQGVFIDENGNTYDGRWVRGVKTGKGKLTYVDGTMYVGDFKDDRIEGQGVLKSPSGMVYDGSWVQDRFEGQGRLVTGTGKEYVGQWKEGMKHGPGVMKYPSGSFYQGDWKENKRHGQGTLDCSGEDGSVYTGQWVMGIREGSGVLAYIDGTKYEGTFKANSPNGVGVYTYGRGVYVKYSGEIKDGLRHGKGTLVWMKGARFEGSFKNNLMHGSGTLYLPDGVQMEGKWNMGKLEGKCVVRLPNGQVKEKDGKDTVKFSAVIMDNFEMQFPEATRSVPDIPVSVPHPVALPTLSVPLSYHHKVKHQEPAFLVPEKTADKPSAQLPPLPPPRKL